MSICIDLVRLNGNLFKEAVLPQIERGGRHKVELRKNDCGGGVSLV